MEKKTFPTKFLLVVALWLPLSNFHFEAYGDASGDIIPSPTACVNCSKCEYPCQQPSPPPPPPPLSGYSIYGAPPPPQEKDHSKCPPAAGVVQCCTPPVPYSNAPPNPYTYVPNGEGQNSASTLLPVLVPLVMHFSFFVFLF